ncbi:MAG: ABC transporter permease [Gammaproteobacteria bacterium]|nr:ABC transporter permease [Gammaproteobacteria bacterium]
MGSITTLWFNRRMLWATSVTDIVVRFKGTVLGLAWTILYPLLFLGLYAVVYTMIFHVRTLEYATYDYLLLIFCGLVPFIGFSEALGTGVMSVSSNKTLIKNTLFPIELVPVKAVLTSSVTMLVGLVLLHLALWFHGIFHATQLLIPVIFLLQILFTIGLIWIFSAINVFIPDLGQMVGILVLFLMLVSPIAYTQDMIPQSLMPLMYPNPLYYLIMLYRSTAFLGELRLDLLMIFSLLSVTMLLIGGFFFNRLKPLFSDYV